MATRTALACPMLLLIHLLGSTAAAQTVAPNASPAAAQASGASSRGAWFDTADLFVGLDGSKQPQDLGINATMGFRLSANVGVPLVEALGLGAQAGVAFTASDAAVAVLEQIEGTSRRTQTHVTVGVFQRPGRAVWSLAYDVLRQQYFDDTTLGQVRGSAGVRVGPSQEVGVWFTKRTVGADATMAGTAVRLDPISQVNGYTKLTWASQAQTTIWAGVAGGKDNVVWVLSNDSRDDRVFVYGADLRAPLNDRFAVVGSANFLTPAASGTVDAFLGLSFTPGRRTGARGRFVPVTPVASSPTMPVNLRR